MGRIDPPSLPCVVGRYVPLSLPSLVAPARPASSNASRRFARPVSATAIDVFMCCCVVGVADQSKEDAADLSRVRPAIAQQNAQTAGQGQTAGRPQQRPNETRAMDFVHDQLSTGQKLRVLTIVETSRGSLRLWCRALPSAARMSSKCWKESGERWGYRPPSGSTRAPSLSRATWIYGPTSAASRSTFLDRESPRTMPLSKLSMVASESNVGTHTGS